MKKIFFFVLSLFAVAEIGSLFINTSQASFSHANLSITIGLSIFYIAAAILTFQAAFYQKILGGLLGSSLKLFSIGLFILGVGFSQLPFMIFFSLWNSPYFSQGIYWIPYLAGLIFMIVGLSLIAKTYAKKSIIALLGICIITVILRAYLFTIPFSSALFKTGNEFQLALTINTVLTTISLFLLVFAGLLKWSFGNSKLSNVFSIFFAAFLLNMLGALIGYYMIIVSGQSGWFYSSGLYFSLFLLSSLLFFIFSLRLRYLKL